MNYTSLQLLNPRLRILYVHILMFIIPLVLLLRTLVCTSMEARIVFYGSKNRRRTMHIRTRLKWTRGRRGRRRRRQQIGSNQSLAPLSVSFLITLYACPRRVRRSFSSILHKQSIQHIRCLFRNNACVTFWRWPLHKSRHVSRGGQGGRGGRTLPQIFGPAPYCSIFRPWDMPEIYSF